jgi:hypothetical protein
MCTPSTTTLHIFPCAIPTPTPSPKAKTPHRFFRNSLHAMMPEWRHIRGTKKLSGGGQLKELYGRQTKWKYAKKICGLLQELTRSLAAWLHWRNVQGGRGWMIVEAMSSASFRRGETWGIFYAGIPSFRTTGGDQPTLPSNAFRISTCQLLKETAVGHYVEMGPRVCWGGCSQWCSRRSLAIPFGQCLRIGFGGCQSVQRWAPVCPLTLCGIMPQLGFLVTTTLPVNKWFSVD